ncbi:hypothetical protein GCM10011393_20820 [Sphingopyxis bauzanensis]|nr:hypothetical protein GCM10011393_20820 [Sphingopyxis bauzanensis]
MDGPNEPLRIAIVAYQTSHRFDAARNRGVGDNAPVPDCFHDIIPGHQPVAVGYQEK